MFRQWHNLERYIPIINLLLVRSGSYVAAQNESNCIGNSTTAVQHLSGWSYRGCYQDGGNRRILNGTYSGSENNTVETCAGFCSIQGYSFFGVEFSFQCFCDHVLNTSPYHTLTEESNCNSACCTEHSVKCGGVWAINVYEATSAAPTQTTGTALKPTQPAGPTQPANVANNGGGGGTNTNNNIALGVGIGIGFPGLIIAALTLIIKICRRKQPKLDGTESLANLSSRESVTPRE